MDFSALKLILTSTLVLLSLVPARNIIILSATQGSRKIRGWLVAGYGEQGRNHGKKLGATSAMMGRICPPPGCNRVKVSQNLGATSVAPVAPVDTSLQKKTSNRPFKSPHRLERLGISQANKTSMIVFETKTY